MGRESGRREKKRRWALQQATWVLALPWSGCALQLMQRVAEGVSLLCDSLMQVLQCPGQGRGKEERQEEEEKEEEEEEEEKEEEERGGCQERMS